MIHPNSQSQLPPEVGGIVCNTDDPDILVSTFRMWFLGLLHAILMASLNQFFSMRSPTLQIAGIVAQIAALPLGKFLGHVLPARQFCTFGFTWSLNPGPFTVKEHVCITIMAISGANGAYATCLFATQRFFYGQKPSVIYEFLLVLSTQTIGFCFSGMLRQYIVWPSCMIWPGALVDCAVFNCLHANYGANYGKHNYRQIFFVIALLCSFLWSWVSGYLFTALTMFNWACWIAPTNISVNALFGTQTGLGMGILTFDWGTITSGGNPLTIPWWCEANVAVSFVLFSWIISSILYFTNTWYTKYMPIASFTTYDNAGSPYNPIRVLTSGEFDADKYRSYSPLFMPVTLALSYGLSFAVFSSVFVHIFLWFRQDIVHRFRHTLYDQRDIHSRLMSAYSEVPLLWYALVGLISSILLVIAVTVFPSELPVWALIIAILFAFSFSLPVGVFQAISNIEPPLQVIPEVFVGYILPGRPIANMIFKTIVNAGSSQSVTLSGAQKLGHYMKIPPRVMLACVIVSTTATSFVVVLVQDWMFATIPDLCRADQKDGFICPDANAFATASLIFGGVGPQRLFSVGQLYSPLLLFFVLGAVAPVPFYLLSKKYPHSFWRFVNIPICCYGAIIWEGSAVSQSSWIIVGFIFSWFARRFHFRWWVRYNYVLATALDAGAALSAIAVYLTVGTFNGGIVLDWWGNRVWQDTADAKGAPMYSIAPPETFGPRTWS